jgi:hypothetical protein
MAPRRDRDHQPNPYGGREAVGFARDTMLVFDPVTEEMRDTKTFVAVLGASNTLMPKSDAPIHA